MSYFSLTFTIRAASGSALLTVGHIFFQNFHYLVHFTVHWMFCIKEPNCIQPSGSREAIKLGLHFAAASVRMAHVHRVVSGLVLRT